MPSVVSTRLHITLTGFGDVGQIYAAALQRQGLAPRIFHPTPTGSAEAAAEQLGLVIERDPSCAYSDCDLVLDVTPGSQALTVAHTAAALAPSDALFADLSTAAPAALRTAATYFEPNSYVDVAIMGAVSVHEHRTPLLASGADAARLHELLARFGFPVEVLPDSQPGDATALKLVRSILTEGMEAVVIECLLVAEALGLRQLLLSQIGDLDQTTLSELMAMFVRTHVPHASRRLQEVKAIEETLSGLGVPLIVTPAARRRFARSIATLGIGAQLPSGPKTASVFDRALPWMLDAERPVPSNDSPSVASSTDSLVGLERRRITSLVQPVDRHGLGVVVAVAFPADRRLDSSFCQPFGVPNGHVLA